MSHISICPGCNKDVSRVRLVNLVYTFEDDGKAHFNEVAWHKQCFIDTQLKQVKSKNKYAGKPEAA